jgi:hypothetical protein
MGSSFRASPVFNGFNRLAWIICPTSGTKSGALMLFGAGLNLVSLARAPKAYGLYLQGRTLNLSAYN